MQENEIFILEEQSIKLEGNMYDETMWLTQNQMSELFNRDVGVISRHIKNIFKEQEPEEKKQFAKNANCKFR